MKWKPQSREALRVVSIMIGPLFETESFGPRPGSVEIRCSITVKTWPAAHRAARPGFRERAHRLAAGELVQHQAVDLQQVRVVAEAAR